jgi:chemotaxis methyl-accepting protein methylase
VDASKENEDIIEKAKDDELPSEMKGMSVPQRQEYVKEKAEERAKIQSEIQSLNKKRQEYIATNTPKEEANTMLDAAMIKAVRERAKEKNLNF